MLPRLAQRAARCRARSCSPQMPPTNRPGASRWSGSNWSLTRRIRSSAGTGPQTSTAAFTAAGASTTTALPPCAGAGSRGAGASAVRDRRRAACRASRAAYTTPVPAEPRTCSAGARGGREHVGEPGEHEGQLQGGGAVVAGGVGVPGVRRPARRRSSATRAWRRRAARGRSPRARPRRPRGPRAGRCTAPVPVARPLDLDRGRDRLGVQHRLDERPAPARGRRPGALTQRLAAGTGAAGRPPR